MVDENSETPDGNNQELHSETVMVAIVGGPELRIDQVDCCIRTSDVDHLVNNEEQLVSESTGEKCVTCLKSCWPELKSDCLTFMLVL